jgi:hypothetical protein
VGQPLCEVSESFNAHDEVVCPLKCPTCWEVFLERLRLSADEVEAMWKTLGATHREAVVAHDADEEDLITGLCLSTIDRAESLVNECISDRALLESQWDAALLGIGEAWRKGNYKLATARIGDLPNVGWDHDAYEARKREVLGACLQG